MSSMFYFRGDDFDDAVAESRERHLPLYFSMRVWADTPSMYYQAGPMDLMLSAGELNKCRRVDMDPALMKKMGVGHIYRIAPSDSDGFSPARILMKLWWQPNRGYFTENPKRNSPRFEYVFDVPESVFLRWIVDDADNIMEAEG